MECLTCHNCLPEGAAFCPRCGARCAGAAEPADYRYAAFISYRHIPRDAEVAKRVQRFIETFRLPRGIAKEQCESSWPIPGKPLGKCFRDEDELAASHSLPESIQTALAQSRWLVIICSPEALESTWIQREIETFAQLHGRERILCVLAEGSSAESVPPLLKSRLLPDTSGALREMPTSPLAADLRNGSNTSQTAELLRVVAAIAGVGYDALRQRERARRHRKIATAAASAAAVLALVGTFAALAHNASQTALIEESKSLAARALDQYERGERLQAIETALAALPSSESDHSRPLVPEAQTALEEVLALNPDPARPWIPLYSVDIESPIIDFEYSLDQEWLAVLDESGTVSVFDSFTGQPTGSFTPTIFERLENTRPSTDWFISAVSPNALLAANRTGAGGVISLDPTTGQTNWLNSSIYALAAIPTAESDSAGLLCNSKTNLAAAVVDTQTGALLAGAEQNLAQLSQPANLDAFSINSETDAAYAAIGSTLYAFDLAQEDGTSSTISDSVIHSICSHGSMVAITETDFTAPDTNTNQVPYSVRAFEAGSPIGPELWSYEDTYSFTVDDSSGAPIPTNGIPTIRGKAAASAGEDALIVTAGKTLLILDAKDGSLQLHHDFGATIVGASPCFTEDGKYAVAVALSDGTLNVVSPYAEVSLNSNNSSYRAAYVLDHASIAESSEGNLMAFIHPADNPNRLLCYLFDYYGESEPESFTLDELIAYAHSALEFS